MNVHERIEAAVLQEELEFLRQHQRDWAQQHQGEFVLIGKGMFCGFHASYQDALRAGVRAFGPVAPFLVRQI